MNSKTVVVVLVVLMAMSIVQESYAFTAGAGGTVTYGGKREVMTVSRHHATTTVYSRVYY